jgi:hypothetical protein
MTMKKILATLFFLLPAIAQAQIVGTLPFQLQNGTTADATQVMADFNKILNDVNINAAKNGVNTDITALNALVTPLTPAQGGTTVYFASTSAGSANAQTVASPSPVGFTLTVGKRVVFLAGFTNTGALTLNVNSTGATNVFRYTPAGPVALIGGEVVANNYIEAIYDGTRFLLYTNAAATVYGPETTLASAATTDLGTISSHNIQVTGVVTITAFGSSAIVTYPTYRLRFAGILTLTHNGTSLILPGAANIVTAAGDSAVAQYLGSGNWQVISYTKASGAAVATAVPTRQAFLSGSGTYTTPANVRYIRLRMVGGGGGGGGANNSAASTSGNQSTFNAGAISAGGGAATSATVAGGAGGSASGGNVFNIPGGSGQAPLASANQAGGQGGSSCLGGGGGGGLGNNTGLTAATNSGGGGGGGGALGAVSAGGGGGAGGCVEHVFAPPAASYTYVVGTGGAGAAGTTGGAGGAGAAGIILVEEYY